MNALRFFTLFAISLTLVFASFGIASAAVLDITNVTVPANVSHNAGSFPISFIINYTGADPSTSVDFSASALTQGTGSVSIPSITTLTKGQPQLVVGTVSFSSFQTGSISGTIIANPSAQGDDVPATFSVPIQSSSSLSFIAVQDMTKLVNGTFKLKNTGNQLLSNIGLTVSGDFLASLSTNTISSIQPNGESSVVQLMKDLNSALKFGSNTVTVQAKTPSGVLLASQAFTIQGSFCSNGPAGTNLSISSVTLRNTGDDDTTWNPLDEITLKVDVENNGLADMKEVFVKIGLFDSSGSNKIRTLDFLGTEDEEISIGTINDGGTEHVEFNFKVPVDLKDGGYKLAVKTFSKRSGESKDCADSVPTSDFDQGTYQTIDVEKQTSRGELVAITNFIAPDQNVCGTTLTGSFDVANVGDVDQDKILVHMRTPGLGADQEFELVGGLDEGDDPQTFNFEIPLPTNIRDGSYSIFFSSRYDYENGAYGEVSKSESEERVKVIGCSGTSTGGSSSGNAAITATLGSDATAGKPLVVNAVIRNVGNSQQTFIIDAKGYQSWATLDSISDRIITLGAGESKSIAITLNVDSSATESQEFTIETLADGKTSSQIVDVKLASKTSSSGFSFAGNGLIWVIGAINLILIILIIVVAVRVSRR